MARQALLGPQHACKAAVEALVLGLDAHLAVWTADHQFEQPPGKLLRTLARPEHKSILRPAQQSSQMEEFRWHAGTASFVLNDTSLTSHLMKEVKTLARPDLILRISAVRTLDIQRQLCSACSAHTPVHCCTTPQPHRSTTTTCVGLNGIILSVYICSRQCP